jgi:hypothetical protein
VSSIVSSASRNENIQPSAHTYNPAKGATPRARRAPRTWTMGNALGSSGHRSCRRPRIGWKRISGSAPDHCSSSFVLAPHTRRKLVGHRSCPSSDLRRSGRLQPGSFCSWRWLLPSVLAYFSDKAGTSNCWVWGLLREWRLWRRFSSRRWDGPPGCYRN